ncbi:MAG: Eco57I restriction-modification methylase domain-containing protein [Actinomycetota bacterium]|nr:Eco57I restriction-modification methylase domain-containing protein [Actinomycetota bacterium]
MFDSGASFFHDEERGGESGPGTDYGEVFTRRWVVDFILDLAGYTADKDLGSTTIVEPACGTGAFLGPIVDRLVGTVQRDGGSIDDLGDCIRAYDLLEANAERARKAVADRLMAAGASADQASRLAGHWVTTGDFLLQDHTPATADYLVGNPPYIRLEAVPVAVMAEYRRRCPTMRGRSDIYVGFIEAGLRMLRPGGALGFICADRWMHNQYGEDLRDFVTASYAVEAIVSMHGVDAFEEEVSAYPAVVVIRNAVQRDVTVAEAKPDFGPDDAPEVVRWAKSGQDGAPMASSVKTCRLNGWFGGRSLWPSGTPEVLEMVADLEARFPPLEDAATGTRVGIGVATGCDAVYISSEGAPVEADRLLPLLRAPDTSTGTLLWSGNYLVNPWDEEGLVDLGDYPLLKTYFEKHASRLRARHVARRRPLHWYRTIDRVRPSLTSRRKLVLPDLKARANPVLDEGRFYPHHNLYFIVSEAWDLEVLGGLLLSQVTNAVVGAYCVKMRGNCCRFQAQYLRRVRVPHPAALTDGQMEGLRRSFQARDVDAATAIAEEVYGIGPVRYLSPE